MLAVFGGGNNIIKILVDVLLELSIYTFVC